MMSSIQNDLNTEGGFLNEENKNESERTTLFTYATVSMLIQAHEKDPNKPSLGNRRLDYIKIAGFVLRIRNEKDLRIYIIDDLTGCIQAKLLLLYSVDQEIQQEDDIQEGDMVEIFGNCNSVSIHEKLSVSIRTIRKLNSFNFICHHQLTVFNNYWKCVEYDKKDYENEVKHQQDEATEFQNNKYGTLSLNSSLNTSNNYNYDHKNNYYQNNYNNNYENKNNSNNNNYNRNYNHDNYNNISANNSRSNYGGNNMSYNNNNNNYSTPNEYQINQNQMKNLYGINSNNNNNNNNNSNNNDYIKPTTNPNKEGQFFLNDFFE